MRSLRTILFFSLVLWIGEAMAQTESTLYFMNSLPQVVEGNPAIMPRYKISIGLPVISSIGGIYSNNGFTYNDFVTKVDGVSKVNLSNWTQTLAEKNYMTVSGFTDLFRLGIRVSPKVYLMSSSTIKAYSSTMLPKGLATLLVDGTAPVVGSYTNTSPQEEAIVYLQTTLGAAYQANEKLIIGGRLKYLMGLGNITTETSSLIVQVDNNYQITATGDARVRTSGVNNLDKSGYSIGDNLKNTGWGLDLGATYKFMDKLTVGAAINDIGSIHWTNNTYQYVLDPAKAKYVFSGFDINELLNNNTGYLDQQLDSVKNKFEMKESPSGSYTTSLPTKFYLSGNYELKKNLSVGALFFGESFRDRFSAGMTASVNKHFGKWVSTSLSYTVSNRSYNNIGMGVSFNLSPVQLYFVGDNLLLAPASMLSNQNLNSYLNSSQLITLRAGLNFVLGWDKGAIKREKVASDSANPKENTSNAKVKTTFGRSPSKKKVATAKKKSPPKSKKKKPAKSRVGR